MIRIYNLDNEKYCDQNINVLLFTERDTKCVEGFNLFEVIFDSSVYGPLNLLKENSLSEKS